MKTEGIFPTYNEILNYFRKLNSNKIIFFLHSDDLIYDKFTLGDVYSLFQNRKLDAIYGNIVFFKNNPFVFFRKWISHNKKKQLKIDKNVFKTKKFTKKDFIFGWSFPHTSFFFHTRVLNKLPKYYDDLKTSSDYGWSIEVLMLEDIKLYFFDRFIVKMRVGGTSTKLSNALLQTKNDYIIIKRLFYNNFLDFFYCSITLFSKKIRKITQFINK